MNRTIEQWAKMNPTAAVYEQSLAAVYHAFKDAQQDIATLAATAQRINAHNMKQAVIIADLQIYQEKMKAILKDIAYPKKGSVAESMNICDAANIIQNSFELEYLK